MWVSLLTQEALRSSQILGGGRGGSCSSRLGSRREARTPSSSKTGQQQQAGMLGWGGGTHTRRQRPAGALKTDTQRKPNSKREKGKLKSVLQLWDRIRGARGRGRREAGELNRGRGRKATPSLGLEELLTCGSDAPWRPHKSCAFNGWSGNQRGIGGRGGWIRTVTTWKELEVGAL